MPTKVRLQMPTNTTYECSGCGQQSRYYYPFGGSDGGSVFTEMESQCPHKHMNLFGGES